MKSARTLLVFISMIGFCLLVEGCETMLGTLFTGTISSSKRSQANKKNYKQEFISSRPIGSQEDDEYEVLARRRAVVIEPSDAKNTTGSLTNSFDPRNNLFLSQEPINVGDWLDVKVVFNRKQQEGTNEQGEETKEEGTGSENSDQNSEISDILAMLPNLDPADPSLAVLTSVKMRVTRVYPSGDVQVSLRRSSKDEGSSYDFITTAKISYKSLSSGKELTTQDLSEVTWFENDEGYVSEKYSSIWEDEYSLRLSGFKETKSKYAMELDKKEKDLKQARKSLESRLKSFAEEKRQFRKKQEKLAELQKEEAKAKESSDNTSKGGGEDSKTISKASDNITTK